MRGRIKALADVFPRQNALVDVGCDHGYLGLELLRTDKATEVVNIDISKSAIQRCEEVYRRYGWGYRSQFVHGDGFKSVEIRVPNAIVVIAGMGSHQILNILEHLPKNIEHLILLSHTDYFPIREWSEKNNWAIKNEKYVRDKKHVYLILDLLKTKVNVSLSLQEKIFGNSCHWEYQMDVFAEYWREKVKRLLKIPFEYRSYRENKTLSFLLNQKEFVRERIL